MTKRLMGWHKTLALWMTLPLFIWAFSGLLHPLMGHFFKPPRLQLATEQFAELGFLPRRTSLAYVLNTHGIERFSSVKLVMFQGAPHYQVRIQDGESQADSDRIAAPNPNYQLRYFAVEDGTERFAEQQGVGKVADAEYAAELVNRLDGSSTTAMSLIRNFTPEYPAINRILPVYRIAKSSGTIFYIDTHGSRISTLSTPTRESLSFWFRTLHNLSFIGEMHSPVRLVVLGVMISGILLLALTGLLLYSGLWRRLSSGRGKPSISQFHRVSGMIICLSLLGFATSGLHTLVSKQSRDEHFGISPGNELSVSELDFDPLQTMLSLQADNFNLVQWDGQLWLQFWRYMEQASTPKPGQDKVLTLGYWRPEQAQRTDADYAAFLGYSKLGVARSPSSQKTVTHFGGSYPFILKRLPVQQMAYGDSGQLVAIETHTGYVAQLADQADKYRSIHFSALHKYHFLNDLGKVPRDLFITLIILTILGTASLGLVLYFKRSYRRVRRRDLAAGEAQLQQLTSGEQ
ncbi:PepSY domain-containing protein [Shewanella corallii]|uniref:PepSY domain-containing protein n=1 Tax=Shewanella corallii TaxID=560080 RepID=A0ABT0N9U1_9GAMM|nr:PepSY domain-containing protein [Shewanella corallii]MCL2915237.1 PepSY domain-containing protein [Shewanella corallii]